MRIILDGMRRSDIEMTDERPAINEVVDSLDCAYMRLGKIQDLVDFGEEAEAFIEVG